MNLVKIKQIEGLETALNSKVLKSTFNANTIIKADTDDTPIALTVAQQTLVGRITGGNIEALTNTQIFGILGTGTPSSSNFLRGDGTWATVAAGWSLDGNTVVAEKWLGTIDNFALPFRTNNVEVARFNVTGDFGIGTNSPSSRLDVRVSTTEDGIKVTIPTGNFIMSEIIYHSISGGLYRGYDLSGTLAVRLNSTAAASSFIKNSDLGIGLISPGARLHIKGVDSTSSNYALKVDNSSSVNLLSIQNDSNVGIGISSPNARLHVKTTQTVANTPLLAVFEGTGAGSYFQVINTSFANIINFSSAYANEVRWYNSGSGDGYRLISESTFDRLQADSSTFYITNGSSGSHKLAAFSFTGSGTGNFYLGKQGGFAAAAKLSTLGDTSDSTGSTIIAENSSNILMFKVRNDGVISAPLLPTSNAGLTTGQMYVDTAANILANGDKIVGWKV